jgi:hypothetical protein
MPDLDKRDPAVADSLKISGGFEQRPFSATS